MTLDDRIARVSWHADELCVAVRALAQSSGLLGPISSTATQAAREPGEIHAFCASLGVEAEQVEFPQSDMPTFLRAGAPAIVRVPCGDGFRFLAIVKGGRGRIGVLSPDLRVLPLAIADVEAALSRPLADEAAQFMGDRLRAVGLDEQVQSALIRDRCRRRRFADGWVLRLPPGAPFLRQLRFTRVPARLAELAVLQAIYSLAYVFSWWMVARGALQGRIDPSWLTAWAFLLIAMVPIRMRSTWLQGWMALTCGALLKQRLLDGALRMKPDEVRHQGCGQMIGTVIESEAVEALSLSGGAACLPAAVELLLAVGVLAFLGGALLPVPLLVGWLILSGLLAWRYFQIRLAWTDARLAMTHDLIEGMVGHRTRLAQEPTDGWHTEEDASLERYLRLSDVLDRQAVLLTAVVPRGWLLIGVLGMASLFVSPSVPASTIALSVGALMLAWRALVVVTGGIINIADAAVAWRHVRPLFQAAARPSRLGALNVPSAAHAPVLMEARDITFRHASRGEPVLRGCSLTVRSGSRVLVEGPSGAGKSTLASILVGIREPESGLLLLHGWDRHTLGDERWRRKVVLAPQFHENHVFSETFAFNLLMGRGWPAAPADLEEAEALCRQLGLGPLLEHMPAGLMQMVGECGWQLSHGERSRLYIARALLQGADLIILDESFAALDPENLRDSLATTLERAPSLIVIAHP